VHYLVLASVDALDSPYDLRQEHLPLLDQMVKLGRRWAGRASKEDPTLRFRFGFHTVSGFNPGISSKQVVH
jgi:aprataxin